MRQWPEEDSFDVWGVEEGCGCDCTDSVLLQMKILQRLGQVGRNVWQHVIWQIQRLIHKHTQHNVRYLTHDCNVKILSFNKENRCILRPLYRLWLFLMFMAVLIKTQTLFDLQKHEHQWASKQLIWYKIALAVRTSWVWFPGKTLYRSTNYTAWTHCTVSRFGKPSNKWISIFSESESKVL